MFRSPPVAVTALPAATTSSSATTSSPGLCLAMLLLTVTSAGSAISVVSANERPAVKREPPRESKIRLTVPSLTTDHGAINKAFRIAIGDLLGNVCPFQGGLLEAPAPVLLAGLDYGRPWTRDASVNAWNGASLLLPDVARNTLLSVLERAGEGIRIGGQYWDAIVWTTGAWNHYLYTGDKECLSLALEATRNSLAHFEKTEFDAESNLFRGPGWSDGVAAYPKEYAGKSSAILDWPKENPDKVSKPGYGIPMKALSTNCLYYSAYVTAGKMALELNVPADPQWQTKADALKKAINLHLWNEEKGCYRILTGPFGDCDGQEALGHSYAVLFGIADAKRAEAVFQNQQVAPAGVPCGWPNFPRYQSKDGTSFGRHCGTVWPQIQGFWADAAARFGKIDIFAHELFNLAEHACRDKQFAEIYHPLSGEIYGGLQERGERGIVLWRATSRQTWAATAFLRMILAGVAGMRFEPAGVRFQPCMPKGISRVELRNVSYRKMSIDLVIKGNGTKVRELSINGRTSQDAFLSGSEKGKKKVEILVQ